jgi:hypothetical protein
VNKIATVTAIISIFFWTLPAIRQYKTNLFFYFLIIALMDPVGLLFIATGLHLIATYQIYVISSLIILCGFFYSFSKRKYFLFAVAVSLLIIILSLFNGRNFGYIIVIFTHLFILFFFARRAVFSVVALKSVNIFHMILILYETSVIMKLLTSLTIYDPELSLFHFFITSIFEAFIAVFFAVFKEENPKLLIALKES